MTSSERYPPTQATSTPRVPFGPMGFNPFRQQDRSVGDVVMVVGAIVATLAVVAWGFFGG